MQMDETPSSETNTTDLQACRRVLERLAEDPAPCLAPDSPHAGVLEKAALLLRRVKALRKRAGRRRDREFVETTGIRRKRQEKSDGRYGLSDEAAADGGGVALSRGRRCYVCKRQYEQLHAFYDLMCPACGDENFGWRSYSSDLSGRTVVLTGGRVKIGFQVGLKFLRAGARVIVTTRFPCDAARRYAAEADFTDWGERLRIHGVDFRWLPGVEALCDAIRAEFSHLDVLINNAAQTIRRPAAFYQHLLEGERSEATLAEPARQLIAGRHTPAACQIANEPGKPARPALLSQAGLPSLDALQNSLAFPTGVVDADGQQLDRRRENSWVQSIADVSPLELLEVHAVNSLVPFLLIQRLESLLLASPSADRYIVNVSAMEGQLNARYKSARHPHTNMAKAGLNMITRTCADGYAEQGIYMNSVDTGWVTNEFPHAKTERMKQGGFQPPLDEIDGAARVCHPVFSGAGSGDYVFGKFLKDYRPHSW